MTKLARRLRAQTGYTLVELMTVLGIVGILMAITAPAISNHIALQHIRGATEEVVTVLREARESAVNEGVPRYVFFDHFDESYQVFRYVGPGWAAETQETRLAGVSFTDDDVDFPGGQQPQPTSDPVPVNAAYFDTRGRYPYDNSVVESYQLTLRGGLGKVVTLTLHRSTGQVTGG